jgi:hypothetical protein
MPYRPAAPVTDRGCCLSDETLARHRPSAVTGRVRILRDGKLLRTLTLHKARAQPRLTGQPTARHTCKATYAEPDPLPGTASVRVVL